MVTDEGSALSMVRELPRGVSDASAADCPHPDEVAEARRIAAVRRYDVLDSPPDGAFERITALAARLLDVPIAIVSIVDTDRIWFKSHHGMQASQIDRAPGLCASAILQEGPWIVNDAITDARTLANPLVAGEFGLRFYAGIPLTTHDNYNVGTLCVIDKTSRELTEQQIETLTDLASLVVDELELRSSSLEAVHLHAALQRAAEDRVKTMRKNKRKTRKLEQVQRTLLAHMPDGVAMLDREEQLVAWNPAVRELLGLSEEQLADRKELESLGKRLLDADGNPWGDVPTPPIAAVRTGVSQRNSIIGIATEGGKPRWLSLSMVAHLDRKETVDSVVVSVSDVTVRHAASLAVRRERAESRQRIEDVLTNRSFSILFQPIVAIETGRLVGVEALARFSGTHHQTPDRWFAEAAGVGLGAEMEIAAVRAALTELDRLPSDVYLSLNVSPESITSPELRRLIAGVAAERLVLELTEHNLVPNYEELDAALACLRTAGVRIAVDDAGAGFAGLQHILNLRPGIIKLDQALTRGIDNDPARRALTSSLLRFGSEIGSDIVAEGIETEAQLIALRALGVRYGQGYLLGRPGALPLSSSRSGSSRQSPQSIPTHR